MVFLFIFRCKVCDYGNRSFSVTWSHFNWSPYRCKPLPVNMEQRPLPVNRNSDSNRRDWILILHPSCETAIQWSLFCHDNEKIRFYTGLPAYDVLSKFQEIVLTLMKLKLNMPMQDLAYCFGISLATVSRIFSAWIVVLSVCLAPLIRWPKYEDSWRTMTQCFQAVFGNKTMVIIKCYEVFITRPSNLMAQAQTFSTYKNFGWNNSTREYFIPLRRLGRKYPR